jgi:hypothetical protein
MNGPSLNSSIAGRIRVISACGAVVVWSGNCCADRRGTDGSGTDTYAYAGPHIGSAISGAAVGAATISAADVNAANASTACVESTAAIGKGISRNTRDAKDGSGRNGNDGSTGHDIPLSRLVAGTSEAQCQDEAVGNRSPEDIAPTFASIGVRKRTDLIQITCRKFLRPIELLRIAR